MGATEGVSATGGSDFAVQVGCRHRASAVPGGEVVVGEVEDAQVRELAELRWDAPCQRVPPRVEVRHLQLHAHWARVVDATAAHRPRAVAVDLAELGRQDARERVALEVDDLNVRDAPDLRRDLARDLVERQVEVRQIAQVAELWDRQVALEAVAAARRQKTG